jgi:hypothetical protein
VCTKFGQNPLKDVDSREFTRVLRKEGRKDGRTDGSVTISLCNSVGEGENKQHEPLKDLGRTHVLRKGNGSYFIRPVMLVLLQPRWHKLSYSHFCIYFVGYILHAFISYHHLARYPRYNISWSSLSAGRWLYPGTPAFSTVKTDRHYITEILLKVE